MTSVQKGMGMFHKGSKYGYSMCFGGQLSTKEVLYRYLDPLDLVSLGLGGL